MRCLVNGCFELLKRKYHHSDVFNLHQLAEVVDLSAACDLTQLMQNIGVVGHDRDDYPNQWCGVA